MPSSEHQWQQLSCRWSSGGCSLAESASLGASYVRLVLEAEGEITHLLLVILDGHIKVELVAFRNGDLNIRPFRDDFDG